MTRRVGLVLLSGLAVLVGSACATKDFVQEQISATESKLSVTEAKVDQLTKQQEATRHETTDLARSSREATTVTDRQLKSLDTRVDEVGAVATAAKTGGDSLAAVVDAAEARLAQRIAGRNRYRLLETKSIYFDAGQAEIRKQDIDELENVAKALKADPNAISELQGFADPRGTEKSNNELSRARVDAVVRHLAQRHGIELRQLQAASMGTAPLAPGEKPTPEALANARRVDIRLLAPWSSWEDSQVQGDSATDAVSASPPTTEAPASSPTTEALASPESNRGPIERMAPGPLREILNTISKEELGGRD
jgi:outer membrane protein OmpA-like peptidoglycan-associated protein